MAKSKLPRPFVVLMVGELICIPLSAISTHQSSTWIQALGATAIGWWMLVFILYIVFIDSKKRWPHLSQKVRWGMIIPGAHQKDEDDFAALAKNNPEIDDLGQDPA
jgi:hypothetical protein